MGHCGGGAVRTATSTGRLRQLGTKRVRVVATQRVSKNPEKILNTRMKKKRGTENRKEKQKKRKKKEKEYRCKLDLNSKFINANLNPNCSLKRCSVTKKHKN